MLENSKIILIIFFNHDNINQNLKNKAPYNLKTPSVTALGVSEWLQAKTLTRKNKSLPNSSVLWTPFIVWVTRLELATSTTPTAPCAFFASFLVRIVRFCKPNRAFSCSRLLLFPCSLTLEVVKHVVEKLSPVHPFFEIHRACFFIYRTQNNWEQ